MKPTLRSWVLIFFGGLALVISLAGWCFVTKLEESAIANGQAMPAWALPVYLAAALLVAVAFSLGFSVFFKRPEVRVIQKLDDLANNELPRLSSALGLLSEGDLTVQIQSEIQPLEPAWYPEAQPQVTVYNHIAQEIQKIFLKFNEVTDEPCSRLVYVGADGFQEGRTCCELMGEVLGGQGKIAILTTRHTNAMANRKAGFRSALNEKYPRLHVVDYIDCQGQTERIHPSVAELLQRHPDLDGIYVTNGGPAHLVAEALVEAGKAGTVKLVCHDLVDGTMRAMQQGVVTSTISQDPFVQGHDPVIYLFNYLVCGQTPPQPKIFTQIDRVTIDNYSQFWDPQHSIIESDAILERRTRPVEAIPERRLRILILGREDLPFFEPVKRGVQLAADELKPRNTIVEWLIPEISRQGRAYGAADYGPAIEAAVREHYDAIAVPVYDPALVPFINQAVAAGIPVATYNSEPVSLRSLIDSLINQAQHLKEISGLLLQSAMVSEVQASKINQSVGTMSQALYNEVQSAVEAIQNTEAIAQAITDINAGAKEQADAVNNVTGAIDQISYAVSSTNFITMESEETAAQAVAVAQEGARIINQTLGQIRSISEAVSASVAQINELYRISRQIDTIVSTVNDFAEQTNLLAMNAAIEAAHAGELGAGFAVVGSEIRKLAKQSKQSTKEIALLINEVQRYSGKMVQTVDSAMTQARSGSDLAAQAGQALDALVTSAVTMKGQTEKVSRSNSSLIDTLDRLIDANSRVSSVVENNVTATEQVTSSIQHTVGMIDHMTGISKENSISIEGIHASTDDVAERAQQLKKTILNLARMAEDLQGLASSFKIIQ